MTISKGSLVAANDFNGLILDVVDVLGNGSGSTGYGYEVPSYNSIVNSFTYADVQFVGSSLDLNSNEISISGHGLVNGDLVKYEADGGTVIGGLVDQKHYFVYRVGAGSLKLANAPSNLTGTIVDLTSTGSGFQRLRKVTGNLIDNLNWNTLRTDVNRCSQHQSNTSALPDTFNQSADYIVGADASGPSVTYNSGTDSFSIDSPNNNLGAKDWQTAIGSIESNIHSVHSNHIELKGERTLLSSVNRTQQWGGSGQIQTISFECYARFDGGYDTTDVNGATTASGFDHFRHYFNAGGEIRFSAYLTGGSLKDSDWGTMLQNMGDVVLTRTSTTAASGRPRNGNNDVDPNDGGGIDNALGAFGLNSSYQIIYQREGGEEDADYYENTVRVYAKKINSDANGYTRVYFFAQFFDGSRADPEGPNDLGQNKNDGYGVQYGDDGVDPPGDPIDEPVLTGNASMLCGLHLKVPNGSAIDFDNNTRRPKGLVTRDLNDPLNS